MHSCLDAPRGRDAFGDCPETDGIGTLLERLQTANRPDAEIDAHIDCFLNDRVFAGMAVPPRYRWHPRGRPVEIQVAAAPACWSADPSALLRLIPADHDFSLGERDGVIWAWIQPHDDWTPGLFEARHDHPCGSGLVVARTVPLALAAALVRVRTGLGPIKSGGES